MTDMVSRKSDGCAVACAAHESFVSVWVLNVDDLGDARRRAESKMEEAKERERTPARSSSSSSSTSTSSRRSGPGSRGKIATAASREGDAEEFEPEDVAPKQEMFRGNRIKNHRLESRIQKQREMQESQKQQSKRERESIRSQIARHKQMMINAKKINLDEGKEENVVVLHKPMQRRRIAAGRDAGTETGAQTAQPSTNGDNGKHEAEAQAMESKIDEELSRMHLQKQKRGETSGSTLARAMAHSPIPTTHVVLAPHHSLSASGQHRSIETGMGSSLRAGGKVSTSAVTDLTSPAAVARFYEREIVSTSEGDGHGGGNDEKALRRLQESKVEEREVRIRNGNGVAVTDPLVIRKLMYSLQLTPTES